MFRWHDQIIERWRCCELLTVGKTVLVCGMEMEINDTFTLLIFAGTSGVSFFGSDTSQLKKNLPLKG